VVRVAEARIDAASAIQFRDAMRAATEDRDGLVVLDLSQVTFIDSSGLGAIVSVMKQLAPDRRLDLAALTPAVAGVFRLTRLDEVFRIHADADAALAPGADAA
jgi:anti-sigma B factor antagonist